VTRKVTPRTRRGVDLWAQLGLLAVAAAVSLLAAVAVLSALGLSPR
jgi:hypothetical protein